MSTESLLAPYEYPHTYVESLDHLDQLMASGVLDATSYDHYQQPHDHCVELVHKDAEGNLKSLRMSGNLRNNAAGDWQAYVMSGGVANSFSGTATASSSTSLTDSGASWTAHAWKHYVVVAGPNSSGTGANVFGMITDNTATALTVDQWYTAGSGPSGTAGSTPNSTATFMILPGGLGLRVIALSTDTGAPATTDTSLASEITTNGLGRTIGTVAHTAVSGGTTTTVTSTYTVSYTFTATGTESGVQKSALFYSAVASTGTAMFENTFSSVSLISGDTLAVTWTINC